MTYYQRYYREHKERRTETVYEWRNRHREYYLTMQCRYRRRYRAERRLWAALDGLAACLSKSELEWNG